MTGSVSGDAVKMANHRELAGSYFWQARRIRLNELKPAANTTTELPVTIPAPVWACDSHMHRNLDPVLGSGLSWSSDRTRGGAFSVKLMAFLDMWLKRFHEDRLNAEKALGQLSAAEDSNE